MPRRLAAILAADAAEYSRLMHEDEEGTHALFTSAMEHAANPAIARYSGRVIKSTGDGFLAEFASAVDAVRCALEFQALLAAREDPRGEQRRLQFRIGINVGDVIVESNDVYGDHVNIAARLQQLAQPGGILISEWVYDYVRGRFPCSFEERGEQRFRNIVRPIRTYRVLPGSTLKSQPASLEISVLGGFTIRAAGREFRIRSLKSRAMLGYIALTDSLGETRERLVGLLWSEFEEEKARASLRQVVRDLRTVFSEIGLPAFRVDAREIGFVRQYVRLDLWEVLNAAERSEAHPLLLQSRHIADELLSGLDDLDPAFRAWLLAKRQGLRDRLLRALEPALDEAAVDRRRQALLAQAILNLDPTHETAVRVVMRARAEAGDTAGALRAYKALWDLLADEYGMEPSDATQQLVAAIKLGKLEPPSPTPSLLARARDTDDLSDPQPHLPGRLALAVGAVDMRDVEADQAHRVHGFRQNLIATLVRFREWSVSAPFPPGDGPDRSPDHRYEIEMLAYQNGSSVNLVLVMKEAESGLYVWSENFELRLEDWFEAQRRIIHRVATTLNVHLSAERLRRASSQPELTPLLFDRWLRCQKLILSLSPANWRVAERECIRIIEAAPHFSPAYSSVVQMHNLVHITHPGILRTREREHRALDLARKAVQLDPVDSRAQLCLGWAHAMAKEYAAADVHIQLALELNPNDPWTLISAALFYGFDGQAAYAASLVRQGLHKLLPLTPTHWAYLVSIEFLGANYDRVIAAAEMGIEATPTVLAWRAAAQVHLGRMAAAQADVERFLDLTRTQWQADAEPSHEAITRWLLHLYPISHREHWERLRDGLRDAGLPAGAAEHHGW